VYFCKKIKDVFMAYNAIGGFPPQQLSFSRKNKAWRRKCVDFGDNHSLLHYHLTRKSVFSMRINYDLLNGKLHMADLKLLMNPYDLDASFIPDNIQHYPIINSKLNVLRGEESRRLFDFRVIVTNPNAVSEIEEEKNRQVLQMLQELISDTSQTEEEFNQELEKLSDYFQYDYQDKREKRANLLLNHFIKEQEIPQLFNKGFVDAYTVGEEMYQCDIVGGEPYIEKLDPMKVRIIRSGYSNKIEDADMIILEDYWSPGRIIDFYWDQLSKKDIEAIETAPNNMGSNYADEMDNIDPRYGFFPNFSLDWTAGDTYIDPLSLFDEQLDTTLLPYDLNGNVRVLRVYWKSRRKIKKVKSYDPETGEEQFDFYPETYHCDPDKGEEEQVFWINEAWEGTKIGQDIYVNMRPRPIQYNRLSNPSRCHFGIIGSIYNLNGEVPFSFVDMMKPYAYLYDVIHDRLNKTLAKNMGKIVRMDFAKVPKGWDVEKWLYYIKVNNIAAEDSFKEGDIGRATGVLAGGLNNASSGVIDASLGNEIQQYISLLEWISNKIGDFPGISRQREGQISNRETVGGVERATLQSSHITEWLFFIHDSVKKRVLECYLETAKIAYRGMKVKFDYILDNGSKTFVEIDGDEFAECDYGLVVDSSNGTQELNQKLDTLAQAALQNQLLDFSTIMRLYTTTSTAEKQRMVEANERRVREQQQQQQQQQLQLQQQQMEMQAQMEQQKEQLEYQKHQEDNETKVLVAQINASAEWDRYAMIQEENGITKQQELEYKNKQLELDAKQFDEKLALDKKKQQDDARLKEKQIAKTASKK
jgi:hypothetical protein